MRTYIAILEDFNDSPQSTLYHATYKPYLGDIQRHGLGGRQMPKNYEDSEPGVVYLADNAAVAFSYAETSDKVPAEWLNQIVVLEVDTSKLDPTALRSDQNVIDGTTTFEYHGVIAPDAISLIAA